jgi:hypothetical protein
MIVTGCRLHSIFLLECIRNLLDLVVLQRLHEALDIDNFLSGVVGLTTLRVIHPIDVLDSCIQNLHLLPEKRADAGIAHARLAVDVARAFIRQEVATLGERAGL